MNILSTNNVKVYFKHRNHQIVKAVDGVDLFLEEGKITSLAGESGCGKTTLARTILRFYKPWAGKVYFRDSDITLSSNEGVVRKNIRIVFQNPYLSFDPRFTVFSSLCEGLGVLGKVTKKESVSIIEKALNEVELDSSLMFRYPHQLSGGQLQRIALARAIIAKPALVILDEPTSSLDIVNSSKIIKLFKKMQQQEKTTFLFISHNLKLIKKIADFCFIMYRGQIVEGGAKDLVYSRPLHPYTKFLLQALDFKLKDITGGDEGGFGCIFRGFCPQKTSVCNVMPEKREIEPRHFVFCHNAG